MKISNIIVVNDFNYIQGGASKVAIDTAKLLSNAGLKVYFFSAVSKKEENIDGITYITTNQQEALKEKNKLKGMLNGIYNFKAKREFKKLLQNFNKEDTIIHIHGWTKALSSSVFDIAFKMNFKVVLTLHDYFTACPNGGYFNYKENKICKKKSLSLKCIKCNCDSRNYFFKIYRVVRQFVQNKIVKLPNKLKYAIGISDLSIDVIKPTLNKNIKLEKIYNPIEFEENEEKVDPSKNEYYLYVGRISKEKGVDIFCKAITELGLKGIAVGDGSEKERLEQEYSNIEFTGWKSKEEVRKYLKGARALIFPSLWYEGAPLTPLEAMGLAIPCAISKDCAGREYISNKNGVLIDCSDLKQVKEQILYLNENIKEMGNNSLKYFYNYSKINYVEKLQKFYEELI